MFMEESLNEKRLVSRNRERQTSVMFSLLLPLVFFNVSVFQADQSAKDEAARYKLETEEAVANELSRLGTPASAHY